MQKRILSLQALKLELTHDVSFGSDFSFFDCNCSSISIACSSATID